MRTSIPFSLRRAAAAVLGLLAVMALAAPAGAIEIERVESPGGITAWLVNEPAVPLVSLRFAFEGGSAQDPDGRSGTANMASGLLDEGAGDLDSQAFQRRLEDSAIGLSFDASRDAFSGGLRVLTRDLDEGVELARLALNEPRFDSEPVERVRRQILAGLRSEQGDPGAIAGKAWFEAAFPGHPYSRDTSGTLDSVPEIEAADLRAYADAVLARDNLTVAVVGDIDAETLAPLLDEIFGALPAEADLQEVPETEVANLGAIELRELGTPQTVMVFGGRGLKRDHEDFVPAYVLNHILGGGSFTSRLFEEVREERGLAYSASTYLSALDHAGIVFGSVATSNANAGETMAVIRQVIERMAEEGPSEEELAKAKQFLIGSYPLRFDTSASIAGQLVQIQRDDLGIDYVDERNGLIEAVSREELRRVAEDLLTGEFLFSVVGEPEGVEARPAGG